MKSRLDLRRILVAVLAGVLIGGGLMAVTPAGAEVAQAAATNWKKIWKKNLQPLADKRYYTKKKSRSTFLKKSDAAATYQPKGSYALAGSSYTKAESDAKYTSKTMLLRGTFLLGGTEAAASSFLTESISFGVTLNAAPTPHFIAAGAVPPAGCSGTAEAPDAQPGHLCVFETITSNVTSGSTGIYGIGGGTGASPMGALLTAFTTAGGSAYVAGSWAVRPAGVAANLRPTTPRRGTLGVR